MSQEEKSYSNKTLIEKLGITKTSKVALVSPLFDQLAKIDFQGHLALSATPQGLEKLDSKLDILIVWVESRENLSELLKDLKSYINSGGAIWTVIKKKAALPKGVIQQASENDIITCAKNAGLVDNKIATISDTEYAFKLVIPLKARGEG
jgi:hypothetical protein